MKIWTLLMPLFLLLPVACQKSEYGKEIRQMDASNHLELVFAGNRAGDKIFPDKIYLEDKKQGRTLFIPNDPESVEQSSFLITPAWSPDGAWLVLPNGRFDGFLAFRSGGLPEDIKDNAKGRRIGVLGLNGTSWWHEFVKWKSSSVFQFRAGLSGDLMLFECDLNSNVIMVIDETQVEFARIPE